MGLPSSFQGAKSSPPCSLPSTYKVLCLGLWEVRGLGPSDLGGEVLLIFLVNLLEVVCKTSFH
jgi:hypothetical protein